MSGSLWQLDGVTLHGDSIDRLTAATLAIEPGITAVLGHSGSGKTSLLNLLVGFERPDAGRITTTLLEGSHQLPLFWVPQDGGLWPQHSVDEHIRIVLPKHADADCARRLLDEFDLTHRSSARPGELSLGERSRLSVVRALASRSGALVMDEPLSHIDPARLPEYRSRLRDHCLASGCSLVFATHEPDAVLHSAQRAICLSNGRVVACGDVDQLYHRPQSAGIATFLGPTNWMTPEDARVWLGMDVSEPGSHRPETIDLQPDPEGAFLVDATAFGGPVSTTRLTHQATQQQQTILHRTCSGDLAVRQRVSIRVIASLLLAVCLLTIGCDSAGSAPQIPVEWVRSWALPPDGSRIPAPRAMDAGDDGDVYVLDDAGRVLIFDRNGDLKRQWSMPDATIGRPESIRQFRDGRIVVADTHYDRVVFFDDQGQVLDMLGEHGNGPGQFVFPVALAEDPEGNFYVGEYGDKHRIQKFSRDNRFLLEFGSHGTETGQFQRPSGIAWHEGRIYVVDAFNNRIQVFSDSGEFQQVLGAAGNGVVATLDYPYDIVMAAGSGFYVVEYRAGRVSHVDFNGRLLGRYGQTGRRRGEFLTPWGLTFDGTDRILVADYGNRRIVELQL